MWHWNYDYIATHARWLQCIGIGLDKASIDLGNKIFAEHGLPPDRLFCKDLKTFPDNHFDYILASEVFEHIEKSDIDAIVELLKSKLKPEGIRLFAQIVDPISSGDLSPLRNS